MNLIKTVLQILILQKTYLIKLVVILQRTNFQSTGVASPDWVLYESDQDSSPDLDSTENLPYKVRDGGCSNCTILFCVASTVSIKSCEASKRACFDR
ncbi:hypothetical protein TNIN_342381 [Trichonephila inaurata madagascariensis]|uniref:Uncharacterized protein n=1 Tax=Trichonephila inaurata madagascariensis TaxID=2747483 RepID=A0A8X6YH14_9ARAC|nr:hypothetical protein TNIN_342381 [Trichonephila inaurata madagascariensis]